MAFISALNPLLLWGGLAIASPIIIHLLSKRRFREVSWAAMDFLLKADRQNRRRIRLEHLLLLLLRCLLILLAAALVARPIFDPAGLGAAGVRLGRREHLILLDDSPSMGARSENRALFETARRELTSHLRDLSERRPQDSVTLLLTSDPERPLTRGTSLGEAGIEPLLRRIENLEVSDLSADVDDCLLELRRQVTEGSGELNHSVLIVSDFRRRDWLAPERTGDKQSPLATLGALAEENEQVTWHLLDLGGRVEENLAVTAVQPPRGSIAAQVPARFDIRVQNFGRVDVDDLEVLFSAAGVMPLRARIDTIAPGEKKSVPFTFTFAESGPARVQAEVGNDPLRADNVRRFAADVTEGTRVLLVDGEPAMRAYNAETFFLRHALAPPGTMRSGYVVDVISDTQLAERSLEPYGMVVLANLFRVSPEQAAQLERYVREGGGLAIFPGDQADATSYNALHESHPRLFPVVLDRTLGDPNEEKWTGLVPEDPNHPVLRVFAGENNPLLTRIKVFRWWGSSFDPEEVPGKAASLLASLNDVDESPAVVQSSLGQGRVLLFLFPADAEWSTWVSNPGYPVIIQEMARHLSRPIGMERQIAAGEPVRERVDPSDYALRAPVIRPDGEAGGDLQAGPVDDGEDMIFEYTKTDEVGFYRLERRRRDGTPDPTLFAVNIESDEGDLRRVPTDRLDELTDAPNLSITRQNITAAETGGQKTELWRPILLLFALLLCTEQLLAWTFDRKRQF